MPTRPSLRLRRWANYALSGLGLFLSLGLYLGLSVGLGTFKTLGIGYALWALLLTCAVAFLAAVRHRRPLLYTVLALIAVGLAFIPLPLVSVWWVLPLFAYHAGKHLQKTQRILVLMVSLFYALLMGWGFALIMLFESEYGAADLAQLWILTGTICLTVTALTWMLGTTSRLRALRQQELEERAQRLEFEREQERSLAAVDERSRIAREMHDIVAHSLSVIVMQAEGGRYAAAASGELSAATSTLEQIAQVSREALAQTRGVLGLLRSSAETELAPLPTLNDLPQLVELARASGLEVEFAGITGVPSRPLAAGVQLAAYRVVQEALTNVRKHASGAPVSVTCSYSKSGVTVEVINEAPPALSQTLPGAGKGLQGMQERVTLYHGELTAAPLFTGGFQVKAFFPYSDN